jgi:hypothetical protein
MKRRKTRKVSHRNIALLVVFALFLASAFVLTSQFQSAITGAPTGVTYVNVTPLLQITIVNDTIAMGKLQPGKYNSTLTPVNAMPGPFVVNNSGNVDANITISASQLFSTVAVASNYYQIRCANASSASTPWGTNCTDVGPGGRINSTVNSSGWQNMPLSAPSIPNYVNLSFSVINQIFFHINVTVPTNEPPANLTSTVTFTATLAGGSI